MLLEEYGFSIQIIKKNGEFSYLEGEIPYFTTNDLYIEDALITLRLNGETLSDLALIWMEPTSLEVATIRFDSYQTICKGNKLDFLESDFIENIDAVKMLVDWSANIAKKYEMPKMAKAIKKLCN